MYEIKFRAWDGFKMSSNSATIQDIASRELMSRDANKLVWMQYIGIKDVNGKELYQGDVIKYTSENDGATEFISEIDANLIYGISFKNDSLNFEIGMYEYSPTSGNFEIIGNIYENKDLLK